MPKLICLILTIISGLFFLLGYLINKLANNNEHFNHYSIAISFVIMLGLVFTHLLPEALELYKDYIIIIIFSLLGFLVLKLLDIFIPSHTHHHQEKNDNKKEHNSHITHIGTITIISLILHNILEGFAIFSLSDINISIGFLTSISIALHNIPLGIQIFSSLNIKEHKLLTISLVLSSLIGGIIALIIGNVSSLILAIITSITMGMLFYIALLELLPEIIKNFKHKEIKIGLLTGLIISVIAYFI